MQGLRWRLVNVGEGSPEVHLDVHHDEVQSDQHVAPPAPPPGERGEPFPDPSARARAQAREEGPGNVHKFHKVHRGPVKEDPEAVPKVQGGDADDDEVVL